MHTSIVRVALKAQKQSLVSALPLHIAATTSARGATASFSTSTHMNAGAGGFKDTDVVVASFARTPIGKMGGALSGLTAPQVIKNHKYFSWIPCYPCAIF